MTHGSTDYKEELSQGIEAGVNKWDNFRPSVQGRLL